MVKSVATTPTKHSPKSKSLQMSKGGQVKVAGCKSVQIVGADCLSSILHEALHEIVVELLKHRHKILPMSRMVHKRVFFEEEDAQDDRFWHYTQIHFSNVSKTFWIQALEEVSVELKKQRGGTEKWGDALLRRFDKAQKLQGVRYMVQLLGDFELSDAIPVPLHYKPLMKTWYVQRVLRIV